MQLAFVVPGLVGKIDPELLPFEKMDAVDIVDPASLPADFFLFLFLIFFFF